MNPHRDLYNELYAPLGRTWSEFAPMDMPPVQPSLPQATPRGRYSRARNEREQLVSSGVASDAYNPDSLPHFPVYPPGSDQLPSRCINPALLSGNPVGQGGQDMSDRARNGRHTRPHTPVSTSKRQSDEPTRATPERPLRRSQRPQTSSPHTRATVKHRSHKASMAPIEVFGHLSKEEWKFFHTSQAVLDEVKGQPGGKQVRACQYINPSTGSRCYLMKCHGMDGEALAGKGFPIHGLENYIRHLWVHRNLEQMMSGEVAPAFLTSWDDEVLDAQKALDDANGVVYPDLP
ncbi:hypothetical protein FRC08_004088 [Ceratobasidium sp. 394]|nr:hypothetical protein FRC08_004088 [Ceratobasidium sp. 394]KAG9092699.1 hypothetical protein FS749_015503 [Ceratobasidium sp. UAMH 11750]